MARFPTQRRTAVLFSLAAALIWGCGGADVDQEVAEETSHAGSGALDDASHDESPDGRDDVAPSTSSPTDERLRVVTTVAPIADLVATIGSDRVEVTPLVPAGGDSHTYEPRPSDVRILTDAQAYIGIGLSLNDAAVDLAREHLPDDAVVALLGETALDESALVLGHAHEDGEAGHTHEDGDAGHTHDDAGHTHEGAEGGPNPHVWTSLRNTRQLVVAIGELLVELDPEAASAHEARAQEYVDELDALDTAIGDAVETIPQESRTLVTYHEAWAYFARDYGLSYATAVQPADYSEPSASEVRTVIDEIRELGVGVVFGSEEFPTPVLESIAQETGADYIADLSDDVLPGEPGTEEHSYLELMRRNAQVIVEGLGGEFTPER